MDKRGTIFMGIGNYLVQGPATGNGTLWIFSKNEAEKKQFFDIVFMHMQVVNGIL